MNKKHVLIALAAIFIAQPAAYAMRGKEELKRKQEALKNEFLTELARKRPGGLKGHGSTAFMTDKTNKLVDILKQGLDVKQVVTDSGDTLFHFLVTKNDVSVYEVVAALGGDTAIKALAQLKNNLGQTPLYLAAEQGNQWVKVLVSQAGANINEPNNAGATALHKAAESNQKETLLYLVKNGGDLTIKNKFGFTPYDAACRAEFYETAGAIADYALKNKINNFANACTIPTLKQGR